jgi:hypothetical protein
MTDDSASTVAKRAFLADAARRSISLSEHYDELAKSLPWWRHTKRRRAQEEASHHLSMSVAYLRGLSELDET